MFEVILATGRERHDRMSALTPEQNETLVLTSAGTPMGTLFRKYWIPATLSERLPEPDCDPIRLSLLGERLVAFRDSDGQVGLLAEACPHRGASLSLGRNEGGGLRCIYHNWKLDVRGNVIETPTEPEDSCLGRSIRQRAYPVREAGGLVWTYMGPEGEAPPFPAFSWLDLPLENIWPTHVRQQCNYLQSLEDDFDASHAAHLHFSDSELESQQHGPVEYRFLGGSHPELAVSRESWGLKVLMAWEQHKDPERRVYWISSFIPPMFRIFPIGDNFGLFRAWVPVDDENHFVFQVLFDRSGPIDEKMKEFLDHSQGYTWSDPANDYRSLDWDGERYRQDREAMRSGQSPSGIAKVHVQDLAIQHSMGPIVDRSRQHLGVTDNGVIELRNYLLDAATSVQEGNPAPGTQDDLGTIDNRWLYGPAKLDLDVVLKSPQLRGSNPSVVTG